MSIVLPKFRQTNLKQIGGLSSVNKPNQPYILNLQTMEYLTLLGLPAEIDVDTQPGWYSVASPGRNAPLYHYTGAETIISFSISWYSREESREDVITKCKWLEALTMNDGYDNPPPEVLFSFGALFTQGKFIVKSAKYRIGNFNREYSMYPQIAMQEIVLARVSDGNPTRKQILQKDY